MTLFSNRKPIIGMVHLRPLPESPTFDGDLDAIYHQAESDARILLDAGIDALIVENLGDEPYLIGEPTSAQLAIMASIAGRIRAMSDVPLGVNVQFNAWQAEIAIAYACRAQFVRVEVFVDTVISAQGIVQPCSAQITRYRRQLGADSVELWADIQTKYTQNVIPQSIVQSALDAQAAGASVLIVTGSATGQATPLDVVREVKQKAKIPVVVGSGTTAANVQQVLQIADGAIVGSALKHDGRAANAVSVDQTRSFMQALRA